MNQQPYSLTRSASLYPDQYAWLLLVSCLDIMLTWVILHLGGREVNGIAHRAIEFAGHWGLIGLKLACVIVVIAICETIGRREMNKGKRLSEWAIAISAFPVVAALVQLALYQGHAI